VEELEMPKIVTRLGTALLAATVLTAPQLATAQSHRDYREARPIYSEPDRHRHSHDNDAVVGAVAGLVIGALIGSAVSSHEMDDRGYVDDDYYRDPRYGASVYSDARETTWREPSRYVGYDERIDERSRRDEDCDDDDRRGHHGRGHGGHRRHHDDWDN
jgi:hypothetical protein